MSARVFNGEEGPMWEGGLRCDAFISNELFKSAFDTSIKIHMCLL